MYVRLMRRLLLLLLPIPLVAQEVSARIEGSVRGDDGVPLAAATILVSAPGLRVARSAVTDDRGQFRIATLPVGTYEVRVKRLGYRPLVVAGVEARLAETVVLSAIILPRTPQPLAEMIITAREAGYERTYTDASTVLDAEQLGDLPLGRNFRDIALLMPNSSPSYFGDAISIGGATGLENQYYVDGIKITSPVDAARSLDLPYNFIEQIRLSSGGATADEERAFGGVVNVVTPSGSNAFEQRVFGFFSSDGLQVNGRQTAGATQTGFRAFDAGLALSGPVVRDRVWFFAAYNPRVERRDHRYPFGPVNLVTRSHQFAAKLNAAMGPRTSGSLTVIGSPTRLEDLQYPPLQSSAAIPSSESVLRVHGRRGGIGGAARITHALSPNLQLETALSALDYSEEVEPPSPAGYQEWFFDAEAGTVSGGHGHWEKWNGTRRSVKADLAWVPGEHELQVGGEYEIVELSREGVLHTIERASASEFTEFDVVIAGGRARNLVPSAYVQARWYFTPTLAVHAGARYRQQILGNARSRRVVTSLDDGLQPRLGLSLDLNKSRSRRVFASFARVADEVSLWGIPYGLGSGYAALTVYPRDPRSDTSGVDSLDFSLAEENLNGVPRRVRGSTTDEWSAGYITRLGARSTLAIRASLSSLNAAWEAGMTPGQGASADFPRASRVRRALEVTVQRSHEESGWLQSSYVLSRTRGNHTGDYKTDYRLAIPNSGPVWGHPAQFENATGLLPQDRTHVFKAMGARRWKRLMVGADLIVASGTPLSELGVIPEIGRPYLGFISERGSAGRTPTIWDLSLRLAWAIPGTAPTGARSRLLVDLQHVGSPRRAVDFDQLKFTCVDADTGESACPNATFGAVTQYQPPMTARVGIEAQFGR